MTLADLKKQPFFVPSKVNGIDNTPFRPIAIKINRKSIVYERGFSLEYGSNTLSFLKNTDLYMNTTLKKLVFLENANPHQECYSLVTEDDDDYIHAKFKLGCEGIHDISQLKENEVYIFTKEEFTGRKVDYRLYIGYRKYKRGFYNSRLMKGYGFFSFNDNKFYFHTKLPDCSIYYFKNVEVQYKVNLIEYDREYVKKQYSKNIFLIKD